MTYDRGCFSAEGLSIIVKAIENAVWHYGQELNDLKGTYRTLDHCNANIFEIGNVPIELGSGVISREGFSVINDSKSMVLNEDGWVEPRKETVDLYFFGYGHRYLECLNDFYCLCGSTPLLPRFALGNWWSKHERYSDHSIWWMRLIQNTVKGCQQWQTGQVIHGTASIFRSQKRLQNGFMITVSGSH